ncbi:DEAD/DEAH box helicase [Desulfatitalea alkaliphila]|uniref:DEAD/DEAH box helicase n=1 Tax=Desulfatitalea alkaliphila TaxID=2929485 RepID=A0AA41R3T0_9BACT|nr:DEAD/DEAH box helicase [Desulfatitalea alkaliphila]MCJ8500261.1 DEAD/DEAH box helicase [Desulfatitalea alkaliphila]
MTIGLTPGGNLRLHAPEQAGAPASKTAATLAKAFAEDWREGLFALAAEKIATDGQPTLRFWQQMADRLLTALCHIPDEQTNFEIPPPPAAELQALSLAPPPMPGGEYLSEERLAAIWHALAQWTMTATAEAGGPAALLQLRAPKWRQVGRVCFHLAENKKDPDRPFAFMATYATGFGAAGQLKHLPLGKALDQYAGSNNQAALIKLLAPVHQAAESCAWVADIVRDGTIFRPMAWRPEQAYRLLQSVPVLEQSGLSVRLPDWWKKRPRPRVSVSIGNQTKTVLGAGAMLDFDARVAVGDAHLSPEELASLRNSGDGLVWFKGQWVEVDQAKLQEAIAHWERLRRANRNGEISFIEGMRLLAGASADLKRNDQAETYRPWTEVTAGAALREVLARLRDPESSPAGKADPALKTVLRPYQREGVAWLHLLSELGLGACLADDMGLGKTIQLLALLLHLQRTAPADGVRRPCLLVVPASLLGNWRDEAARFAPSLKLLFAHPAETERATLDALAKAPETTLAGVDLVVTTYAMVGRQPWLARSAWRLVILDEAQAIKNPATSQSKAVKKLTAGGRIALTGTPVENRLGDLWSLFDFLNPGLLGSATVFKSFIKQLHDHPDTPFAPLRQLVAPYILRRLKTDRRIIADLPDKTETARYCHLTKSQVRLYEQIVRGLQEHLAESEGMARRGLVLQTLMRLKQVCNHPSQLSGDMTYNPAESGKFRRLGDICQELAERQEKVLVFTQFREIIPALADHLAVIFGRAGLTLHGGTNVARRRRIVEQFQDETGPPFFILSLKAGGTGLNLTAATHVIHFDRWWNPAVENQATDRAFRIGQQRNVLVHKFITRGTIEERIDALMNDKRRLAEEVLSGEGEVNLTELDDEALIRLVQLDVGRASA